MILKNHVPSDNFNRVIHKRRRRRVINKIHGSTFDVNTLSRLPLQITNDPFAREIFSSFGVDGVDSVDGVDGPSDGLFNLRPFKLLLFTLLLLSPLDSLLPESFFLGLLERPASFH
ncbi:hypothetical protein RhiirA1_470538 [Rhizophagus irregularis]|uniref:Uncharacterized protein n=1 Tax=Rhizophagus irregularis TaxID=588596 RepID=A0A2N0R621_9GLOM|nr:hypothetical protein RhiirA1_470538 [Rhizophagus irregularis]